MSHEIFPERRKLAVRAAARLAATGTIPPDEAFRRALRLYMGDKRIPRAVAPALVAYVLPFFDLSRKLQQIECESCGQPTRYAKGKRGPSRKFCDGREYRFCKRDRDAEAKAKQLTKEANTLRIRFQPHYDSSPPRPIRSHWPHMAPAFSAIKPVLDTQEEREWRGHPGVSHRSLAIRFEETKTEQERAAVEAQARADCHRRALHIEAKYGNHYDDENPLPILSPHVPSLAALSSSTARRRVPKRIRQRWPAAARALKLGHTLPGQSEFEDWLADRVPERRKPFQPRKHVGPHPAPRNTVGWPRPLLVKRGPESAGHCAFAVPPPLAEPEVESELLEVAA